MCVHGEGVSALRDARLERKIVCATPSVWMGIRTKGIIYGLRTCGKGPDSFEFEEFH